MESLSVQMVREDLEDIPQYPLPAGYAMRLYRPGDRETWMRIHREAESPDGDWGKCFDGEFGGDLAGMAKRCCYLVSPRGRDVGTVTAWYDRRFLGRRWGRIHYVAIVPEHRGKGLSRSIMTVAMERLRRLGHRRAMLVTQTHRIPAIRTYLRFGFVPEMTSDNAARAWKLVAEQFPHPALERL